MVGTTARGFLATALIYGIVGIVAGLVMAITEDHSQLPTHAHIMVIGWISFFMFALFYDRFEERVSGLWSARSLLDGANLKALRCLLACGWSTRREDQFNPLAAVSAIAYAISFLAFAAAAWPLVRKGS